MNEFKLKPCPFCGGTKIEIDTIANSEYTDETDPAYEYNCEHYGVYCNFNKGGCGTNIAHFDSPDEAAEAWNGRC